jgi:hypothetical protein
MPQSYAHEGLADYYEGLATKMQAKVTKQEALREHMKIKAINMAGRLPTIL